MALFKNILGAQSKEDKEVLSSLNILDRHKVPIRLEIENTTIHFKTLLSMKSGTVVVAKPLALYEGLSKGGTVRFKIPDSEGKEIRMEIVTTHFNLTNGNPVFLCKVPSGFAESKDRGALRYNMSNYSNVQLLLDNHKDGFRIVDLSTSGCKIYIPSKEALDLFPIGEGLENVKINIGNRVQVNLTTITPRNHRAMAVGCSLEVMKEGNSRKYLQHLINSMEKTASKRYRT